jgi:hypothetical protein
VLVIVDEKAVVNAVGDIGDTLAVDVVLDKPPDVGCVDGDVSDVGVIGIDDFMPVGDERYFGVLE